MTKSEWRKKIKQVLVSIEEKERKERSLKIGNFLFETSQWRNSKVIGITVSRNFELDTSIIIEKAWIEGKTIGVPKCYKKNWEMEFRELRSLDELENIYMDLFEPIVDKTQVITSERIDLLVVPGLVFDRSGYRIGYGGGYYDRYLANFNGSTVALAFMDQMAEKLPYEEYDIPVEQIITEKGLLL
ncbi:5-formyltetrahydrofolate cyclo-ligase [Fictibacillus barbaricus]|uniref:5-formyltetrahydrofolate cyclo-ligase n=1 Tax=Fictibacillus barbaricus TaxID=182136 RepID=A0ABU1TZS7_9BACL|nr:5-formyltetrahydrofolate cyclo-ligase [Fictibacillus barbaricus]MDR7072737.1 5-formyltetrahydrofolate cyclo-ligase [Fictibacillus barbaricus]